MSDAVVYDREWSEGPYRSEALYRTEMMEVIRAKPGKAVQVIAEHGDKKWTDTVLVRWEQIPDCDMGLIRFIVAIDGKEHMVSEDRIRIVK